MISRRTWLSRFVTRRPLPPVMLSSLPSAMPQTWLLPNRRVLLMAMVLPAIVMSVAVWLAATTTGPLQIVCGVIGLGSLAVIGMLGKHYRQPRLARDGDELLVYLKSGAPYRLPLEVVECFFLGATDGNVPGGSGHGGKVSALVVRLAERATDWHERPVKPSLGKWDEGYVRVYGAWCERLCMGLVGRLNTKLREAQRESTSATDAPMNEQDATVGEGSDTQVEGEPAGDK